MNSLHFMLGLFATRGSTIRLSGLIAIVAFLVSACQPVLLEAPGVVAAQPPASGPPAIAPVANVEESQWQRQALDDILRVFAFPAPLPDVEPLAAQGTFGTVGPPLVRTLRAMEGNCIIDIAFRAEFIGTVSGAAPETKYQIFVDGPCEEAAPGRFNEIWQATGTFEGMVDGVEGSFDFIYVARVEGGGDAPGLFDAKIAVLDGTGTGGLANLRGVLVVDDQAHGPGVPQPTYSGQIYFE